MSFLCVFIGFVAVFVPSEEQWFCRTSRSVVTFSCVVAAIVIGYIRGIEAML